MTLDLGPAADRVLTLSGHVTDAHLDAPTPCGSWPVAQLLDHLVGLTGAFTLAADKITTPPPPDFTTLDDDWRDQLRSNLEQLAAAWRRPEAWQGETTAGGVTMPAEVMGVVALDELVLHGWDLAVATGQPFHADPDHVEACTGFAAAMSQPGEEAGRDGLYGPVVTIPADAPPFHHLLGYAGRTPGWTPPT